MNSNSHLVLPKEVTVTAKNQRIPADSCFPCSTCHLRKLCIPRDFNKRETLRFESILTGKRRIPRHRSLYRRHDVLGMLYVVRFGQFKLIGGDQDNEQRVAGFAMAGDLLGLDAIATGRHNFRLMALENSEVCEIPYAAFSAMMNVEPTVQRQFLETISAALNDTYERSFLLAKTSQDARFAGFLLAIGEKFARLGYSDGSYQLSMPRSDIGSFLGTSPESVSRLISRFNAQGAVTISGRTVKVHDRAHLHYLMQGGETAAGRPQSRRAEAIDGMAGSDE